MYYLLGYKILARPENLLYKEMTEEESNTVHQRVKLTSSQLRHRRQAAHFTRSVIFNYVAEEVHTQVRNLCFQNKTYTLKAKGDITVDVLITTATLKANLHWLDLNRLIYTVHLSSNITITHSTHYYKLPMIR